MGEQKAFRGVLWAAIGMEQYVRDTWERFTPKNAWPGQFRQMRRRKGKMEQTADDKKRRRTKKS